jgi:hypothetical protein
MALKVESNHRGGYLRVTITGSWPAAMEQARIRAGLMKQGVLRPDSCLLIDLREVIVPPTADDLQGAIATAVAQQTGMVRRALLIMPQHYDSVRALEQLADDVGAPIRIFADERAAVRWLTTLPRVPASEPSRWPYPTELL